MKSIELLKDVAGKRALVRVDFNVPVAGGVISETIRIDKALPTIVFLQKLGMKVVLVAHLENEENDSLVPIFEYLKKSLPVFFVEDFTSGEGKKILADLKYGEVALLQNIRRFSGEKKNDPEFAKQLSEIADIYVNNAFSVSHRAHASLVGVTKFLPSYAGLLLVEEVKNLSEALHPKHPFLFILGGAKFETKMPLVEKFLALADHVFIGGALANDLLKAKGFEVGVSLVSDAHLDLSKIISNPKLILPTDVTVRNSGTVSIKKPSEVLSTDNILDVGPDTVNELSKIVANAKCILWNGPLGEYEGGFKEPTLALAKVVAQSEAESIVGGGDTLAAIQELHLFDKFSFVSLGGGATLDFLANGTLPAIEVLN